MSKNKIISGLSVEVRDDRFEKALRQFNRKVQNSGILKEAKERRHYTKPSEARKIQKKVARRRQLKKLRSERQR